MITIENKRIGISEEPYIVAELSANHNGSFERAKDSILEAKRCGAHAVKIQTYNADTMTIDTDRPQFIVKGGLWDGYKLYDLYREAHTPYEWHADLFAFARKIGITMFSTPFDESAIELLERLNTPAYKIASFELTDLPLIRMAAKTGKPLLISTGMASEAEISDALEAARSAGCSSILLFHCISSYPAPVEQCNLRKIVALRDIFNVEVGLSDHSIGSLAATSAVALGATAIEKHFTLSRAEKGPDSEFSAEPKELQFLVRETRQAWLSLGTGQFVRQEAEGGSLIFRRSLYFVRDLKKGDVIGHKDIRRIRPGYGLAPKFYDDVIGSKVNFDITKGDPVTWDRIQKR